MSPGGAISNTCFSGVSSSGQKETDIMLIAIVVISLGAAIGALCRWGLGNALNMLFPTLPPGTLIANLIGAYIIGVAIAFFASHPTLPPQWRFFIVTGFTGGLTTFSTFSAEIVELIQHARWGWVAAGIASHVGGSVAMTLLGIATFMLFRPA